MLGGPKTSLGGSGAWRARESKLRKYIKTRKDRGVQIPLLECHGSGLLITGDRISSCFTEIKTSGKEIRGNDSKVEAYERALAQQVKAAPAFVSLSATVHNSHATEIEIVSTECGLNWVIRMQL